MDVKTEKICTKCKIPKNRSEFRQRTQVRKGKAYYYPEGACIECERKIRKEKYKNRDEKEKIRSRAYARKYQKENYKKISDKNKETRKLPGNRILRHQRKYFLKNKEKIIAQQVKTKRAYQERIIGNLSDIYVSRYISSRSILAIDEIRQHPDLIETYRELKKINRLTHAIENEIMKPYL